MTWPNGAKYEGEFWYDKREGQGEMLWENGKVYNGAWVGGKQHGYGSVKSAGENSKPVKGEWVDGKRSKWLTEMDSTSTINSGNSDENVKQ